MQKASGVFGKFFGEDFKQNQEANKVKQLRHMLDEKCIHTVVEQMIVQMMRKKI
jgi:hypothetical protein